MLYAFGSNGSGQLGVGHLNDLSSPELSTQFGDGEHVQIRQIAAGGNHTLVVDHDGNVTGFGDGEAGQCVWQTASPSPCDGLDAETFKYRQVSATWAASICLSNRGTLCTAGQGVNGELGLGIGVTSALRLTQILDFPPTGTCVVQVSSCMAHTVAVLDNGDVYGWGRGGQGQLGEPAENVRSPRKIEGIPFPAIRAVCGKDFTCILGSRAEGKLLILGLKKRDRFGVLATQPAVLPGWKDVAASWGSVFILMPGGEIVSFGRDDHGQLPPCGLPPIESISAGSEHCLALTKTGAVLAWGWGEHGNCGKHTDSDGDVKGRWNEINLPESQEVIGVYAGCATSFVVTAQDVEQRSEQSEK